MENVERRKFRALRWTAVAITLLAWTAFLASFFLPTAREIGALAGIPPQNGWETFVESLEDAWDMVGYQSEILYLVCWLSPVPNGLMLFVPLANLTLKRYAAVYGVALFLCGTTAIWICWKLYDGLSIGYFLWNGSILAACLASFLISGSYFMEDNAEHARLLEGFIDTCILSERRGRDLS